MGGEHAMRTAENHVTHYVVRRDQGVIIRGNARNWKEYQYIGPILSIVFSSRAGLQFDVWKKTHSNFCYVLSARKKNASTPQSRSSKLNSQSPLKLELAGWVKLELRPRLPVSN